MPSIRTSVRAGAGVAALVAVTGIAAAQSPDPAAQLGLGVELAVQFVVGLLFNLVLGGLLVAVGPQYARECIAEIRDDPGESFLWGLLVGIGVPIALVLLVITIVGILVTIPGLILVAIVGVVGDAVAIVWVGDVVTGGHGAASGKAVAVGALAMAVVRLIPLLGGLAYLIVSLLGTGVVGHRLYRSWAE